MPPTSIRFGTDGWRGVIADDFTFANVRRVAQATADYWKSQPVPCRVIVGYDNRFFSEVYARLVCEVLAANGFQTWYAAVATPTPAISYAVHERNLCGAVMITASHNPPRFNGYKLKADYAGSADPAVCRAIESRVDQNPVRSVEFAAAVQAGRIQIDDPRPAHLAAIKRQVDIKIIRRARLRVVIDSMHGCGGRLLETLLGKTAGCVTTIRATRDPLFGGVNPEPIGKNLGPLCAAVKQQRAHVGLATDGDADRLGIVDDRGRYVSIQLVFAVLVLHLVRNRRAVPGLVVKSTNGTVLIDRICQAHGLPFVEVPVGFKYICEQMRQTDVLVGGEESGGIGFRGHIPERDGLLACLMLLELLAGTGQTISQAITQAQQEFGRSVYDRVDIPYPLDQRDRLIATLRAAPPDQLLGVPVAEVRTADGVKYVCADGSWLMFRTSGTEPIVRIYSEAPTTTRLTRLLRHGQQLAQQVAR